MEEKLKLLWLVLIFVDFGLMFVSFPILIYVIFCMTWIQKAFCKCPFPVKRPDGHLHYATADVYVSRDASKILLCWNYLKTFMKLTLRIWNDTIKLNILQNRLHKILFWYEVRILYFIPRLRINRWRHKKSRMDSWSVFFCLAKCFNMYQIQSR